MNNSAELISERCPGLYCGRTHLDNGLYSVCGACPRGFHPDHNRVSVCVKCEDSPTFYDWLYLGFMACLPIILHWFFIDYTNKIKSWKLVTFYVMALLEGVVAALISLLLTHPIGDFSVTSCHVQRLSDWYTVFYNPKPDYTNTVHCTQEAVYPLFTVPIVYYAFCLLLMVLVRPAISSKCLEHRGTMSIYAAMYFYPILVVAHSLIAGLLYYSFPYIVLVASLVSLAIHLTSFDTQETKFLLVKNFTSFRNIVILIGHWLLHSYAIISITQIRELTVHLPLLIFVPFPFFLYVLTVRFTDPNKLEQIGDT